MCSMNSVERNGVAHSGTYHGYGGGHRNHLCPLRSPGLPLRPAAARSSVTAVSLPLGPIDMQRYPRLQPHVTGRINRQRILDWWDEMLRVAGSLKLGWVTASLLVQKLQAYPQQNALARGPPGVWTAGAHPAYHAVVCQSGGSAPDPAAAQQRRGPARPSRVPDHCQQGPTASSLVARC